MNRPRPKFAGCCCAVCGFTLIELWWSDSSKQITVGSTLFGKRYVW
jgi:hypothetical protein